MFYVYEWFVVETGEVIYVGKGTGRRYKVRKHNGFFNDFIRRFECDSRIIAEFENEEDAFAYEFERVNELRSIGQCVCNIYKGGFGGSAKWWTDDLREQYSQRNVMKSSYQRERMSKNNPMRDGNTARKVGEKLKRAIVINEVIYERALDAAKEYGVTESTIRNWCIKGKTPNGQSCSYKDGGSIHSQTITNINYDKSKHAKPVIIDGKWYESLTDAALFLGSTPSNLRSAIIRDGKYKGHTCKYANQQPSRGNTDNSTPEGSTTNE